MARDSSSRGGFGAAWIGAGAALVAALIGAAAVIWQTNQTTSERPAPTSGATQVLNGPSSQHCQPRTASEITVSPASAKTGDTIKIVGHGFPGADKVWLAISGGAPDFELDLGHIGTRVLDSCGRFEHPWMIPPTLEQTGGTRFRIDATGQNAAGADIGDGANDANTEFTLIR